MAPELVLCFNCNQAKEYWGMCPHERFRLGFLEIDYVNISPRRNRG